MQIIVSDIYLSLDDDENKLIDKLCKILHLSQREILEYKIIKKAVDARIKNHITFNYSLLVTLKTNKFAKKNNVKIVDFVENLKINHISLSKRPVIVGFGPAGIFLGLFLARAGAKPIIIERGKTIEERDKDIDLFKKTGKFDTKSNVCFGEGGAGTYSDGKLATGIKDPRIRFCLKEFIKHGAPPSIYYEAHPHIGSDYLKIVVKNFRKEIVSLGGEIRFSTLLKDIKVKNNKIQSIIVTNNNSEEEILTDDLILAIGHSARDTYEMLYRRHIYLEPKPFSMGLRIEHLQKEVNKFQYGINHANPKLPVADYKLAVHLPNGRTVYSFCMCPGGLVVASNSEKNSIVTNGMSFYQRDLENANSALLVNVEIMDYYQGHPLDGVKFQQKYEQKAFNKEKPYFAPVQLVKDFLNNQSSVEIGHVKPTYLPGYYFHNLNELLPNFVSESLREALEILKKKYKFFEDGEALLTGIETRSSSPIRIPRNEQGFCNIEGIYPCGEGASYAGGIMSAAIDGLRIGDFILKRYLK